MLIYLGLRGTAAAVAAAVLLPAAYFGIRTVGSKFLYRTNRNQHRDMRSTFRSLPSVEAVSQEGHTHAVCAADRAAANTFIQHFSKQCGYDLFMHQMSRRDQDSGCQGSRTWYFAKDVQIEPTSTKLTDNHVVGMVDVDYYENMPRFLCEHANPTIMYSFIPPSAASKGVDGYQWQVVNGKDGREFSVKVAGGADYHHPLWDYHDQTISVSRWFKPFFPYFSPRVASFLVERRAAGAVHQLIYLNPIGVWTGLSAVVARAFLSHNWLRRFDTGSGDYATWTINSLSGAEVTIGKVGSYLSTTLSSDLHEALVEDVIASAKGAITPTSVYTRLVKAGVKEPMSNSMLANFYNSLSNSSTSIAYSVDSGVRMYQSTCCYEQDAKPLVRSFMEPVCTGAYTPADNRASERQGVKARVTDLVTEVKLKPFLSKTMREFVDLVTKDAVHSFTLSSVADVYQKQNRPSQRRILEEAEISDLVEDEVLSFIKKEAYGKVTDPRLISTLGPRLKLLYSLVIYTVSNHLKQFDWYAFAKTPAQIAERVAEVCSNSKLFAVLTDFSRMDGRVSNLVRDFELMFLLNLFDKSLHPFVEELYRLQYNKQGRTRRGVIYETRTSRCSGSPETSSMNTLLTAYVSYLALRLSVKNETTMTPQQAFDALGIYGGDDGLSADISEERYERASRLVGQVLKCDTIQRSSPGVMFLARRYGPDVWAGDSNSCSDIRRQMVKFHLTVGKPDPAEKAVQKAMSFILTDPETPVLGPLCSKILADIDSPEPHPNFRWWDQYPQSCQFPNTFANWMVDYLFEQMPDFDLDRFNNFCHDETRDPLTPPLCWEEPVEVPDDTVLTVGTEELVGQQSEPVKRSKRRKRRRRKGRVRKDTTSN